MISETNGAEDLQFLFIKLLCILSILMAA